MVMVLGYSGGGSDEITVRFLVTCVGKGWVMVEELAHTLCETHL